MQFETDIIHRVCTVDSAKIYWVTVSIGDEYKTTTKVLSKVVSY